MKYLTILFLASMIMGSCARTDLFEKNIALPSHQWENSFKPTISFNITDTVAYYYIFMVVRHTDAYHFNNLWLKMKSTAPGGVSSSQQFDLPLASQTGWTGTGMDDIYEHRILLYRQPVKFLRQGEYSVVLEQVMRENPLEEILNVGIRLEKVKQQ